MPTKACLACIKSHMSSVLGTYWYSSCLLVHLQALLDACRMNTVTMGPVTAILPILERTAVRVSTVEGLSDIISVYICGE